jgi:hypothetical protein
LLKSRVCLHVLLKRTIYDSRGLDTIKNEKSFKNSWLLASENETFISVDFDFELAELGYHVVPRLGSFSGVFPLHVDELNSPQHESGESHQIDEDYADCVAPEKVAEDS